ncbi:MAG: hypothetical protein QOF30_1812 [Acidimicrobiaceae bacterium]|nr:hypothetical protein [Acidimicrobiaceae bacterium]
MQLVSQVPSRPVLLVIDDKEGSVLTRVRRAAPAAEVVGRGSSEGAWSALTSGRRYSAMVAFGVDCTLAATAVGLGVPVIEVTRHSPPAELAATITALAAPVSLVDDPLTLGPASAFRSPRSSPSRDGRLLAVCGPGGTGASSIAAALAEAFARPSPAPDRPAAPPSAGRRAVGRPGPRVLLADFARRSDQAFLHGLEDPGAGLLPLVDAARYRPITAADVRCHTVARHRFRLLAGLRHPWHWTAVSPTAFDQLLTVLPTLFDLVVADITGDFEGEADSGSCDVEERNHIARRTARAADLVVVVGGPGANGGRRLSQVVDDLLDLGVDPARIQPAVRASAPHRICGLPTAAVELPPMARTPGRLLPRQTVLPVAAAVVDLLSRLPAPDRRPALVPVVPGSLGCLAP